MKYSSMNSKQELDKLLCKRKIIIWMTPEDTKSAKWTHSFLSCIGLTGEYIEGYCSHDDMQFSQFRGKPVLNKSELNKEKHFVIIASPQNQDEIANELSIIGFAENKDFVKSLNDDIDIRNLTIHQIINYNVDLSGRLVLDLCCGTGDLARFIASSPFPPEHIVGIDLKIKQKEIGSNYEIFNGNAHELPFQDNSFDRVYSYSTFEHIYDIEKTLSEVKRVLKPRGVFFTTFSLLWTCVCGHHFWKKGATDFNREYFSLIPAWGHLYMNEHEMRKHLQKKTSDSELIGEMIDFIYHGNFINRHSRKYHVNAVMNSGMIVRKYSETSFFNRFSIFGEKGESELTPDIISKAVLAGYDASDLGISGMTILLEKYESM